MGEKSIAARELYEQLLAHLQRFSDLNREAFEQLIPYLEIRRFDKRKILVKRCSCCANRNSYFLSHTGK